MNIIEKLPKTIVVNHVMFNLEVHVTAWDKLCICYREIFAKPNALFRDIIISVVVEESKGIKNITNCIGEAPTFDEAAQMLLDYVVKHYSKDYNKAATLSEYFKTLDKDSDEYREAMGHLCEQFYQENKD